MDIWGSSVEVPGSLWRSDPGVPNWSQDLYVFIDIDSVDSDRRKAAERTSVSTSVPEPTYTKNKNKTFPESPLPSTPDVLRLPLSRLTLTPGNFRAELDRVLVVSRAVS